MINGNYIRKFKLPKLDGGLNLRDLEYKIENNQSPSMLNMWYKERTLSKRWGQKYTVENLNGEVHTMSGEYNDFVCIHAGTVLYKWDIANETATSIQTGIADNKGAFVDFNSVLYYIDGAEIYQIASNYTVSTVTPHTPTTFISCSPDFLTSTASEAFNLLSAGFKVTYDGDGTSTSYQLPLTGLDATTIICTVGGVAVVENTGFTANRTTGVINFLAGSSPHGAPADGLDNVSITAYKTVSGNKEKIVNCKTVIAYGGESSGVDGGSRVFVMRNSTHPLNYWKSDLGASQSYGMSYFPEDQEELLDQNSDAITGAGKQLGELIIFKTKSVFSLRYEFDGETVYFPTREINARVGCDMPYSIQLIDNHLVFFNMETGGYMVVNTSNIQEENIKPISGNIDGTRLNNGLLNETQSALMNTTSYDYNQQFWLCVGENVYVWDYGKTPFYSSSNYEKAQRRLAWYKFDNINANCFYGDTDLYYGDRTSGKIIKFINQFSDFGEPINSHWTSKSFDFGEPSYEKTTSRVFVSLRPATNSQVTVEVINEKKDPFKTRTFSALSFSFETFSFDAFSFAAINYAKPFRLDTKMKKRVYCQIRAKNNENSKDMGLTDIVINYYLNRYTKNRH